MNTLNLYTILSTLCQNSIESVQTGNGFNKIDEYLHTERRSLTDELLEKMIEINDAGGGLILLVGSSGDGKSHLISQVKGLDRDWGAECFYNDATASSSPNKTAVQTLKEGLIDFSDVNLPTTHKKKILAINLGKLNAFIDDSDTRKMYSEIAKAAEPLFDDDDSTHPLNTERIKVVEFSNKQIFEFCLDKDGIDALKSDFLSTILDKLVEPNYSKKTNPFYQAYNDDLQDLFNRKEPIVLNYQLLMLPEVRKTIVLTVIEAIIRFKLVITPREYLDFIYSILVPKNHDKYTESKDFYESLLPTLLYAGGDNTILEAISQLDPMKHNSTSHDNDLSLLFTSNDIPEKFLPDLKSGGIIPEDLLKRTRQFYKNNGRDLERTTKFLFRLKHILNYHSESSTYLSYIEVLKNVFSVSDNIMDVYELVANTIPRHYGSYYQKPDSIPLNIQGGKYKLFAHLQMNPITPKYVFSTVKPWEFYPRFKLLWELQNGETIDLKMDYSLYSYLYDLQKGKLAISYENEKNIEFSHFLRKLASLSDCSRLLTVLKVGAADMTLRQSLNSLQLQ